jgi:hypothetical protein
MSPAELIQSVTQPPNWVTLEAGKLKARVPADLLEALKVNRDVVLEHLKKTKSDVPLSRLYDNLKVVHEQLEDDHAQGFILEVFDFGVPSKLTIRGTHHQALERAVRQAQERTPDAERVIVWTVQPDGWETICAQFHESSIQKKWVKA